MLPVCFECCWRCLEDPASPPRSGWLSGLAERPRLSPSLNKGGFKKQKPSGLVLSKPQCVKCWLEPTVHHQVVLEGSQTKKSNSHCISVLWGRSVPAQKKVKFARVPARGWRDGALFRAAGPSGQTPVYLPWAKGGDQSGGTRGL